MLTERVEASRAVLKDGHWEMQSAWVSAVGQEAARGDLVSLLINLSLKDWERTAFHEVRGERTLAEEIEEHVDYDETQRGRLRALLERG